MAKFVPTKSYFAEVLLLLFRMCKSAHEAHESLTTIHGDDSISLKCCQEWYKRFEHNSKYVIDPDKKLSSDEIEELLAQDSIWSLTD